jgi:uncharacterized membrane protein
MTHMGLIHLASALIALAAGALVLLNRKGTRAHRAMGWTFAASMLVLNASALTLYRLTGSFGPFHFAALASLATLIAGVVPARRRLPRGRWLARHYYFMTYAYMGLVAAAVAESATRIPAVRAIAGGPTLAFWVTVALSTIAVVVTGVMMIRRSAPRLIGRYRPAGG